MTTERRDGPTPAGGAYSVATFVRDLDDWTPVEREDARAVIVGEYDDGDHLIAETVARARGLATRLGG